MFESDVLSEIGADFGPVRALRALELWLFAALVALVPLQVVISGVGFVALQTLVSH